MIRLYLDHNVKRAIAEGLRRRGVEVVTAYEDGSHILEDPALLDRATGLNCALFTHDDDLLREANIRQSSKVHFAGVVFVHQESMAIGAIIDELEVLAKVSEPPDLESRVVFLPW